MVTHTFEEFEHSEAALCAALAGVQTDLMSAVRLCEYFTKQMESGSVLIEVTDAFSTAILIRYFRAFPPGVRDWPWEDCLRSLTTGLREAHDRYFHIRSKHVAHSINALEENRLQARYVAERPQEGITAVSVVNSRVLGLSGGDVAMIRALALAVLRFVDDRLEKEKLRLLPIIQEIGIDALRASRANLEVASLDPSKAHERRRRP